MFLLLLLLPPLALYLMVLGWINRRPRPVLMAGTWEFAGVLLAVSGFLLVGGPALLDSLDEQSRWFWLLGQTEPAKAPTVAGWGVWVGARIAYFLLVAGVAALFLWRGRRLTSVYNVDSHSIFTAIEQALGRLGLSPRRTGDSFHIGGQAAETPPTEGKGEGIQTAPPPPKLAWAASAPAAALHVDVFPAMRHATLRWDPADSPLRREVEKELAGALAEAAPADAEAPLGGCLSLLGFILFVVTFIASALLLLFRYYPPR